MFEVEDVLFVVDAVEEGGHLVGGFPGEDEPDFVVLLKGDQGLEFFDVDELADGCDAGDDAGDNVLADVDEEVVVVDVEPFLGDFLVDRVEFELLCHSLLEQLQELRGRRHITPLNLQHRPTFSNIVLSGVRKIFLL